MPPGVPRIVTFEFVEPEVKEVELTLAHSTLLDVFDRIIPMFRALQEPLQEVLLSFAGDNDLPPLNGRVNGFWVTTRFYVAVTDFERALGQVGVDFFALLGLQERDRVRSINGIELVEKILHVPVSWIAVNMPLDFVLQ